MSWTKVLGLRKSVIMKQTLKILLHTLNKNKSKQHFSLECFHTNLSYTIGPEFIPSFSSSFSLLFLSLLKI